MEKQEQKPIHAEREPVELVLIKADWYKRAFEQTIESLPAFLQELRDFDHCYATISYAVTASGLAGAYAMDKSSVGGLTEGQAQTVMWEFIKAWMKLEDTPMRLYDYADLLYPNREVNFRGLSKEIWQWIQATAFNCIKNAQEDPTLQIHKDVIKHWKNIVKGQLPYGFRLV